MISVAVSKLGSTNLVFDEPDAIKSTGSSTAETIADAGTVASDL